MFAKVYISLKKKNIAKNIDFYKMNIFSKHPQIAKKNAFKVWKIGILLFFPTFSENIEAKLTELESESEGFLSKVKIYNFHLPITT